MLVLFATLIAITCNLLFFITLFRLIELDIHIDYLFALLTSVLLRARRVVNQLLSLHSECVEGLIREAVEDPFDLSLARIVIKIFSLKDGEDFVSRGFQIRRRQVAQVPLDETQELLVDDTGLLRLRPVEQVFLDLHSQDVRIG